MSKTERTKEKLSSIATQVGGHVQVFGEKILRTKTIAEDPMETPMKRCLSTFDITLLGIGHMVGAGIYVMTGAVAKDIAGPSIILSFALAGFASLLSSLCYAEFGARVPRTGSAYTYTYVTVGEFWAFVIGWNIILEHLLGAAAVARSWSGYLDSMLGNVIKNGTIEHIGKMEGMFIGEYPDFIAFCVIIIVGCFVASGAQISINFNTVFTFVNLGIVVFVIVGGFYFTNVNNWTNPHTGGFLPFGFHGVVAGAATCFFAYIGFDGIATAAEEAKDPAKSLPIATITAMFIVSIAYILVSAALTLMISYKDIEPTAAFAEAFSDNGVQWAKYVVAVGALCGMTTSLLGSMFALPRCAYAMACDGLIFRIFSKLSARTQVPVFAIAIFGFLSALVALLFEIKTLVEFLSIGTLLAYTIVSASVVVLRYKPAHKIKISKSRSSMPVSSPQGDSGKYEKFEEPSEEEEGVVQCKGGTLKPCFQKLKILNALEPGVAVCTSVIMMIILMMCLCGVVQKGIADVLVPQWWAIILALLFGIGIIICIFVVLVHEQSTAGLTFKVPFVPLLPTVSMLCNAALMMNLSPLTWLRFAIWMVVGLLVYFAYGIHESSENDHDRKYSVLIPVASQSAEKLCPMDETVHLPQPPNRDENNYGAMSPTDDVSPSDLHH